MRLTIENDFYVTLDVGGSFVKAALLSSEYEVVAGSFSNTPIDTSGPSKQVIDTIIAVIAEKFRIVKAFGEVKAIGLCFPEFSDYSKGTIAMMKDKFQQCCGIVLRDEIINGLRLSPDFQIVFEEDSLAFMRGALRRGKAEAYDRIIGLTLGTGLGSAFMEKGKIIRNAPGVPPDGELGCLPLKGGIIEDIISIKGILRIYRGISRKPENDVKTIALQAQKGDAAAMRSFDEFGKTMGQILKKYVEDFRAECIILGGQIAKSFELFATPLRSELSGVVSLQEIVPAASINFSSFYGLLSMIKDVR